MPGWFTLERYCCRAWNSQLPKERQRCTGDGWPSSPAWRCGGWRPGSPPWCGPSCPPSHRSCRSRPGRPAPRWSTTHSLGTRPGPPGRGASRCGGVDVGGQGCVQNARPSSASIWVPSTHSFTFPTLRYLTFCKMYCFGPAKSRSFLTKTITMQDLCQLYRVLWYGKFSGLKNNLDPIMFQRAKNGSKRHKNDTWNNADGTKVEPSLQSGRNGGTHQGHRSDTQLSDTRSLYRKMRKIQGSCGIFGQDSGGCAPVPLD